MGAEGETPAIELVFWLPRPYPKGSPRRPWLRHLRSGQSVSGKTRREAFRALREVLTAGLMVAVLYEPGEDEEGARSCRYCEGLMREGIPHSVCEILADDAERYAKLWRVLPLNEREGGT